MLDTAGGYLPGVSTSRPAAWMRLLIGAVLLLSLAGRAAAVRITIDPPGEREFVRDLAEMIADADETKIRQACDKLLTAKATPIIVVTIVSMAKHGGADMRIETFTRLLFDQWGVGHAELSGQAWNTGILMLVSKGDRKLWIEMGAGWDQSKHAVAKRIIDEQIIPRFKAGNFSEGIVAGVESLDKMARGLKLPRRKRPWWHYGLMVGFVGLLIFTIFSLIRRGSGGWAWLFWGAAFALIGYLLYSMLRSSGRGGGFSGGSFGGGFGGGGAGGSW